MADTSVSSAPYRVRYRGQYVHCLSIPDLDKLLEHMEDRKKIEPGMLGLLAKRSMTGPDPDQPGEEKVQAFQLQMNVDKSGDGVTIRQLSELEAESLRKGEWKIEDSGATELKLDTHPPIPVPAQQKDVIPTREDYLKAWSLLSPAARKFLGKIYPFSLAAWVRIDALPGLLHSSPSGVARTLNALGRLKIPTDRGDLGCSSLLLACDGPEGAVHSIRLSRKCREFLGKELREASKS